MSKMKQYTLALPVTLYQRLQSAAKERGIATVQILRQIISLGFLALEADSNPDMQLILRTADGEKEIVFGTGEETQR